MTVGHSQVCPDDGSTQPMETQVYQDYYLNIKRAATLDRSGPLEDERVEYPASGPLDQSLTGSSDHSSPGEQAPATSSPTLPNPHGFLAPKTPVYAGRKRNRLGTLVSSVSPSVPFTDRPSITAAFKRDHGASLTQLFQNTQADSSQSSQTENIRSDPIFERPSPRTYGADDSTSQPRDSSPQLTSPDLAPDLKAAPAPHTFYRPVNQASSSVYEEDDTYLSSSGQLGDESDESSPQRKTSASRRGRPVGEDLSKASAVPHSSLQTAEGSLNHCSTGPKGRAGFPKTPGRTRNTAIVVSSDLRPLNGRDTSEPTSQDEGIQHSQMLSRPLINTRPGHSDRAGPCARDEGPDSTVSARSEDVAAGCFHSVADSQSERPAAPPAPTRLVTSTQPVLSPNANAQNIILDHPSRAPVGRANGSPASSVVGSTCPSPNIPETSPADLRVDTTSEPYRTPLSHRNGNASDLSSRVNRNSEYAGPGDAEDSSNALHTPMFAAPTADATRLRSAVHAANPIDNSSPQVLADDARSVSTAVTSKKLHKRRKVSRSLPGQERRESAPTAGRSTSLRRKDRDTSVTSSILNPHNATSDPQGVQPIVFEAADHDQGIRVDAALDTAPEPTTLSPRLDLRDRRSTSCVHDQFGRALFRIWACFKGFTKAPTFYPASCMRLESSARNAYLVLFDDGTETTVEGHLMSLLDLRPGDHVKVDMPGLRNGTCVIRGFKDPVSATRIGQKDSMAYDMNGYQTISLCVKNTRSAITGEDGFPSTNDAVDVPVSSLYVTHTMWPRFEQRGRQPTSLAYEPLVRGPGPRDSISPLTDRALRTSRHTTTEPPETGLFSGMAFAVSFSSSGDGQRERIVSLARRHGARLLSSGFEELFTVNSVRQADDSDGAKGGEEPSLRLCKESSNLGFVAVVADMHLRTAKYLQALALNIPCVSGQWIRDCAERNLLQPWTRYLLPAGESSHLGGAVRSRVMSGIPAADAASFPLRCIVEHRPMLLKRLDVLVVLGRGKMADEQQKILFLAFALGANSVQQVQDMESVGATSGSARKWDIICVRDDMLGEARKKLPKWVKADPKGKGNRTAGAGQNTRRGCIVDKETLVQSLVLGELWVD